MTEYLNEIWRKFGYFHTTFYFLLRCEEIQKQLEKNVG